MAVSRREILALLIALGAAVASVVVWAYGGVDVGLALREDGGRVFVQDVTPDGVAARYGLQPGLQVLDLTRTDGADVARGAPLGQAIQGMVPQPVSWPLGSVGGPLQEIGPDFRPPSAAVEPMQIQTLLAGQVFPDSGLTSWAQLDRRQAELDLRDSIWLLAVGIALGVAVWRVLAHGLAGAAGREQSVVLGAAAATPFLLVPLALAGAESGLFASYLVPAGGALLIGLSLAVAVGDPSWRRTALTATLVAAGLTAVYVVRYMTLPAPVAAGYATPAYGPFAPTGDRSAMLVLVAAITLAPAVIGAVSQRLPARDGAQQISLGLVPAAALTAIVPLGPVPAVPLVGVALLLGWQIPPISRGSALVGRWLGGVRPGPAGDVEAGAATSSSRWRDRLTLALLGFVALLSILNANPWAAIIGAGLATAVAVALRRGFLGERWTGGAVPLAAAVGVPIMLLTFPAWGYGGEMGWTSAPMALAALSVADLLAERQASPWRGRLLIGSIVVALAAVWLSSSHLTLALMLIGIVPLVPGVPAAMAEEVNGPRALTTRLETLAVAATPGAAATVLVPYTNAVVFVAWLVGIVIWRRFTLAPLLGLARRTQLQRDLAVAAAETERARLAADLHDDALQQLTMLVRTLDEADQKEAADTAREVANKLRSIVGDLRLPILDDLGAGAALEWLVDRVEPLAGGPVRLELAGEARAPASVELAVFRVAQEALANAIKHGRPPIAVRYEVRSDGRVTLAVEDAGPGIAADAAAEAPGQGHFGLANMQQRAEQIGALLDVRRWPAGGTRVALEWRPA